MILQRAMLLTVGELEGRLLSRFLSRCLKQLLARLSQLSTDNTAKSLIHMTGRP